jgi:SAM-dependent methyltransferase
MNDVPIGDAPARAQVFLEAAATRLVCPVDEVCRVVSTPFDQRTSADAVAFQSIATVADELLRRRRYTQAIVDGFYVSARKGQPGEGTFVGGLEALSAHSYQPDAVASLPVSVAQRFLGLGNVWRGVESLDAIRLLDVGCGAGTDMGVAHHLARGSASVVGIDSRPDLLGFAANAWPSSLLVVGDAMGLPFAKRSFDVVVANGLPPLQRPSTMSMSALQLCAVTVTGGRVAVSVLVAAPTLLNELLVEFADHGRGFVRNLATLATGKPTVEDVESAFIAAGAEVEVQLGTNPYRDAADRAETAMLEVVATPR